MVKYCESIEGEVYMKFRKKDYIIFYVITIVIFAINLMNPIKVGSIFGIIIGAVFPALILGTITNFLFKKK